MKTYTCPTCSETVPLDDINVSTDTALCRSCGEAFPLSTLTDSFDDSITLSVEPPRGLRVKRSIQGAYPELIITYKRRTMIGVLLFTFFMYAWYTCDLYGVYAKPLFLDGSVWGSEQVATFPFLLGSVSLFSLWLFTFVCKRTITVCNGKGRLFAGVGGKLGMSKHFTYNRQTILRVHTTSIRMNHQSIDELQIITHNHKKVTFMIMRPNNADEYAFISATLRTFFHTNT